MMKENVNLESMGSTWRDNTEERKKYVGLVGYGRVSFNWRVEVYQRTSNVDKREKISSFRYVGRNLVT